MANVKVLVDRQGKTLTVWFGNPTGEYVCEETGDDVILMKDRSGNVIGFEKLNYQIPVDGTVDVGLEMLTA